jgi:hypothetical protein
MAKGLALDMQFDASRTVRHFDKMPKEVRTELVGAAKTLDRELVDHARALASGDLVGVKTGKYRRSIRGSVRSTEKAVTGRLYSKSPLAHIIEEGAVRSAYDILPDTAQAMAFLGGGASLVLAKRVHHPGSKEAGRHVLEKALKDKQDDIFTGLNAALNAGLAKT